ncbi:MAG: ClbS/DfsB family four-helix bundle protein [Prevotellaceae bacterium]|jgi:hypothetical protein|nr:ClbS/DfsB family four-helix bundle protein [Prevotellaceae bacterium]
MSRPATKTDLVSAANEQFGKLWKLIDSMIDEEQNQNAYKTLKSKQYE